MSDAATPAPRAEPRAPLLDVEGITKHFGATIALSDVSFDVRPGEVHALMGENGAGKSTLMKIISGNIAPDAGTIRVRGEERSFPTPRAAQDAGIAIIHQELNTVPEMSVAENLSLGQEPRTSLGLLDRRRQRAEARAKLARVGASIDPDRPIGQLSVGMQQMIEIARAIAENARVLVLDEPTAALSRTESETLFRLIREMRDQGMGLVYISHRMEEVWELADRVTVFRDGRLVGTRDKADVRPSEIVHMMVGRDVDDLYIRDDREPGDVRLEVQGLSGGGIGPVDLEVRSGEVLGMVGLIGAGRTEVARMIYGADPSETGTVRLDGEVLTGRSPSAAIDHGIGLLPESRKDQALFPEMSVKDNATISVLQRFATAAVIRFKQVTQAYSHTTQELRLKTASPSTLVSSLSGGNQQKVVLSRMLLQAPKLLILDEPTRGIDIGAKNEIYRIINEIAGRGTAILLISSDLPEAMGISHRLLVMREGRTAAVLDAHDATEQQIMEYATGVFSEENQGTK